ncbi:MAG: hypothetical protein K2K97_00470, partial [Muribaculaceae bacterium]|nr:hypothetical protein [Muribaculaceae bacterium]
VTCARKTAISLFGLDLTYRQKKRLKGIYNAATNVLFEDYFAKTGIATVQSSEVENDEVKDDVFHLFLDLYSRPGDDDPCWWMFTHINEPNARKRILFVKNIEDAANNDFDEVPWVFTTDRYPFDIEFGKGKAPIAGAIYEIDPINPDKYNRIK